MHPVRIWDGRVDPPLTGEEFGIDTETTPIVGAETPDLVLMQVSDGVSVDVVPWDQAGKYLEALVHWNKDPRFYFQNAAFDLRVLASPVLMGMLERDKVIDVGVRHRIHRLAVQGYFESPVSLVTLAKTYLHIDLPKPEEIRLGFRRDIVLSADHVRYAALDALVTVLVGKAVPPQPTECLQTRASLALDLVGDTGMLVDRAAWNAQQEKWGTRMEAAAEKLRLLGLDPDPKAASPRGRLKKICDAIGVPTPKRVWTAERMRTLLEALLVASMGGCGLDSALAALRGMLAAGEPPALRPEEMLVMQQMLGRIGMAAILETRKTRPYLKACDLILTMLAAGQTGPDVARELGRQYQANGGWTEESGQGPGAFMQSHLKRLEQMHGIQFPRTKGGPKRPGQLVVGKDELWRLRMRKVRDELLETYVEYKHAEKMISTYLDDDYIAKDGRVHPHFNIMVRTGRTSCWNPNLQNLPNEVGMREVFVPQKGTVLVAIDYRQLELCALAQHCHAKYGRSRMREIINAGVDLHGWFAARVLRLITDDNDYSGSPESLAQVNAIIAQVPKAARQRAKAANFGFPGGMGVERFLTEAMRHGMYDMTREEAEDLREAWFQAFPEMQYYMSPTMCEDRRGRSGEDPHMYLAETLTGRMRRYCTFNSACNFPFQGLASDGAKIALWALIKGHFRVVNFVHDEFILEVDRQQLHERTLAARRIMEEAMAVVMPNVKVSTTAAAMLNWCKGAEPVYDASGKLVPWVAEIATIEEEIEHGAEDDEPEDAAEPADQPGDGA